VRAETPPLETQTTAEAVEALRRHARARLNLDLAPRQLEVFAWYLDELRAWNLRHNLTAVVDPADIAIKHFLDSLTLVPLLGEQAGGTLIDVGTGAGFPGLPLRIACPNLRLTLLEATAKKAEFCRHVIAGAGLRGVTVIHGRAEDLGREAAHREAYDLAAARAVASLPALLEYLLPLTRLAGRVLAQKGEGAPAEVQQSVRALEVLGGRLKQVHTVELPGVADRRYIVEVEKVAAVPQAYPRRSGVPTRRPIGA
jgi:16S rRNA (guanine527-N7)-methyltransferase